MAVATANRIVVGNAIIDIVANDGMFESFGAIAVGGVPIRNPVAPFRPWFDRYEGGVFNRFRFDGIESRGDETVVNLTAFDDTTYPFRERRDASGDICFRNRAFDAPCETASLRIVFAPAKDVVGGHDFDGFTYHFEYEGGEPIHRIVDLSTWELGGALDGDTLVCRNWLTSPRVRLSRDAEYSTVGLGNWAKLLPGNLWGRWTLLPGFDFQYGPAGILVGRFSQISLVRTVIETAAGEDALRVLDSHWFENARKASTNPKTILFCPDRLDDVAAQNLWTEFQDADRAMGRAQFGLPEEEPPRLSLSDNTWRNFNFDTTYDDAVDIAAEFGLDQVFVDVCWEQGESLRMAFNAAVPPEKRKGTIFEKYFPRNMCCVYDFKVAAEHGGEAALKRLCDRAAARGVKVISWMATHATPTSAIVEGPLAKPFKHGEYGAIAATESRHHPSGGYAGACWTLNLNGPIYDYVRENIIGVCRRTGLNGFLWDSYCNLGWWQVDYSDESMRPQFDKMGEFYAELVREGLYIQPEALVAFSSHSCCGLHGGDVYAGDQLGFSYDTMISFWNTETSFADMLRGKASTETLFRCLAHRRAPSVEYKDFGAREEWSPSAVAAIKELFAMYRAARGEMHKRTVLEDDMGVLWSDPSGRPAILWSFREQPAPSLATDIISGQSAATLSPFKVYRI